MSVSVEFLANRPDAIGTAVQGLLVSHDTAFFAAAYGTHKAFDFLNEDHAMTEFLGRGARLRAVLDIDSHFTDPDLIDELLTIPGDVECRLYAARIRRQTSPQARPPFHAKIYYFEKGSMAAALVGSCNLTMGGLKENEEAALRVSGPCEEPLLKDVRRYLEELWASPLLVTMDQYEHFRDAYAKTYRQAADRHEKRGVLPDLPPQQTQQSIEALGCALDAQLDDLAGTVTAYILGLVAGGGKRADPDGREVDIELRRGLLNRGGPREGRVFFEGVSERDLPQIECVRRDAERIRSRLAANLKELQTGDEIGEVQPRGKCGLTYRLKLRFAQDSPVWKAVRSQLKRSAKGDGRYTWPTAPWLDKPLDSRAFIRGYMDIKTRVAATDAPPGPTPLMRVAVSVGGGEERFAFAKRLRRLIAREFKCDPKMVNLLLRTDRETLIRIYAQLIRPPNFVESPWQRLVIEDFRTYNEGLKEKHGAKERP